MIKSLPARLTIIILAIASHWSLEAVAQEDRNFNVGLHASANYSFVTNYRQSITTLYVSPLKFQGDWGYSAGLTTSYRLTERLSIQADCSFGVNSWRLANEPVPEGVNLFDYTRKWLRIPVLVKVNLLSDNDHTLFVGAGTSFNYLLRAKAIRYDVDGSYLISYNTVGITNAPVFGVAQAGIAFNTSPNQKCLLSLAYERSLSRMTKTIKNPPEHFGYLDSDYTLNSIALQVAYTF